MGSLVAALASYLDARANAGKWMVRIEDLDTPRCVAGADRLILDTLACFGLEWDEPVMYQSARTDAYRDAFDRLRAAGWVYPCSCSRKESGPGPYPGSCRNGPKDPSRPASWRVRFDDEERGDFVVLRADGLFSYQLAVVVDDAAQGITHVVRGEDLLDSTPWQNWLQRLLGYPVPRYCHIPLVRDTAGDKLSKQTGAEALDPDRAPDLLRSALRFLNQPEVGPGTTREVLASAVRGWDANRFL